MNATPLIAGLEVGFKTAEFFAYAGSGFERHHNRKGEKMKTLTKTKFVKIEVEKNVTQTLSDTIILKVPADYTEEQIKEPIDGLAYSDYDLDGFQMKEREETDISTSIVGTAKKAEVYIDLNTPAF